MAGYPFMYFDLLASKHYWIILINLRFQSFDSTWTYLMKVIPETRRAQYIGYLRCCDYYSGEPLVSESTMYDPHSKQALDTDMIY